MELNKLKYKKDEKQISYKYDKSGVLGLNLARSFIATLLSLAVLMMIVIIVLNQLDSTSVANDATKNLTANVTHGILTFASNIPTFMSMLAIAVIILVVSVVFVGLRGFNAESGGGGGGL